MTKAERNLKKGFSTQGDLFGFGDETDAPIIYKNSEYTLRFLSPEFTVPDRVVVTFPDLIHPTGPDAPGWGTEFLLKRGAAVISVLIEKTNWYQSPEFFLAMEAAKAYVAGRMPISTYGTSMGGYGAILAAKRLGADRVVALCPQFSIDPTVVPFEHRYREEASEIGPFIHDVTAEMDDQVSYFAIYDPTHRIDRRHISLFPKPPNWHNVVQPGSSHGILQTLVQAGGTDALFDLIVGKSDHREFRNAFRAGRRNSYRYIKRIGNLVAAEPQRTKFAHALIDEADAAGMGKFANRWRHKVAERYPTVYSDHSQPLKEVVLHVGPPHAGGAALQRQLAENQLDYRIQGMAYATNGAGRRPATVGHDWLSTDLTAGKLTGLQQVLAEDVHCPRLFLSDENLLLTVGHIRRRTLKQFRMMFRGVRIRVLACLPEDPATWRPDMYRHAILHAALPQGLGAVDQEWAAAPFDQFAAHPDIAAFLDIDAHLQEVGQKFGAASVTRVVPSEGQGVVTAALTALGLKPPSAPEEDTGLGMPDVDLELVRQALCQGTAAHAQMSDLLNIDYSRAEGRPLKIRLLNRIHKRGDVLDWVPIKFQENPPLTYTSEQFASRKAELWILASDIARNF